MKTIIAGLAISFVSLQAFALTAKDLKCRMTLMNNGPYTASESELTATDVYSLIGQDYVNNQSVTSSIYMVNNNVTVRIIERDLSSNNQPIQPSRDISTSTFRISNNGRFTMQARATSGLVKVECARK